MHGNHTHACMEITHNACMEITHMHAWKSHTMHAWKSHTMHAWKSHTMHAWKSHTMHAWKSHTCMHGNHTHACMEITHNACMEITHNACMESHTKTSHKTQTFIAIHYTNKCYSTGRAKSCTGGFVSRNLEFIEPVTFACCTLTSLYCALITQVDR